MIAKAVDKAHEERVVKAIGTLLVLASQGLNDVFFVDESSFSLQPEVPYRWQKIGTQLGFASTRKRVMSVLGFLNPLSGQLITYQVPAGENMNSETFVRFVNDFVGTLKRATTLVLDNASYHKSVLTRSHFEQWEKQGLTILFLPPRSPHLNVIEILWAKLKYNWLGTQDFRSVAALERKLNTIFKNYGGKWKIDFSLEKFKNQVIW